MLEQEKGLGGVPLSDRPGSCQGRNEGSRGLTVWNYVVGGLLVVVGVLVSARALPTVHWAARVWPEPFGRTGVDRLSASSFLLRLIGSCSVVAGAAMILFESFGG